MKMKTDENLPIDVVEMIRREGHDVVSVIDQRLAGKSDPVVAEVCRIEDRALVTLDLDFADLRAYPPDEYPGIVVLRPRVQTISFILRLVERMIRLLPVEPLAGICGSLMNNVCESGAVGQTSADGASSIQP